jgi:DNA-binding transcriptional MerR regulator
MALLTPTEAAKAVGKARSTIYAFENNGMLASTADPVTGRKMFDTAELLRVFKRFVTDGESGSATPEDTSEDALEHAREAADAARDDMIAMLKEQLDAAKAREARLLDLLGQAQQLALPAGKGEEPKKKGFFARLLGS